MKHRFVATHLGSVWSTAGVILLSALCGNPASAVVLIPPTPFVATTAGIWDAPGNEIIPEVLEIGITGPVTIEVGSAPSSYGRFRSAYGSNGFEIQVTGGIDRQVAGGSVWSDAFTMTGGTGSGTVLVSSRIQGVVSGAGEMGYALVVSDHPFDFGVLSAAVEAADSFGAVQVPDSIRVIYTGLVNGCTGAGEPAECAYAPHKNFQGTFDETLSTSVPFTYGETLYVASLFAGGVGVAGGSANFYNSANFGITAPAGASLQALSGASYVAAVPEPAVAWLWVVGMAIVVPLVRRRAKSIGSSGLPMTSTRCELG